MAELYITKKNFDSSMYRILVKKLNGMNNQGFEVSFTYEKAHGDKPEHIKINGIITQRAYQLIEAIIAKDRADIGSEKHHTYDKLNVVEDKKAA